MIEALIGFAVGLVIGALVGAKHNARVTRIRQEAEAEAAALVEAAKKRVRASKAKSTDSPPSDSTE